MNKLLSVLIVLLSLTIPGRSYAWSSISINISGGSYHSVQSVRYSSYTVYAPVISDVVVISRPVCEGVVIYDRRPHFRPISERPAYWYKHSNSALRRERFVSHRTRYYGGRW